MPFLAPCHALCDPNATLLGRLGLFRLEILYVRIILKGTDWPKSEVRCTVPQPAAGDRFICHVYKRRPRTTDGGDTDTQLSPRRTKVPEAHSTNVQWSMDNGGCAVSSVSVFCQYALNGSSALQSRLPVLPLKSSLFNLQLGSKYSFNT